MLIAVLGAGKMGSALAHVWARAGHRVVIGSQPHPGAIAARVAGLGPSVSAMSNEDAVSQSEVIVPVFPWAARTRIAGDAARLAGKIVLDAMNAYGRYPRVVDLEGASSNEVVASEPPWPRVVKGLNTLQARDILARGQPGGSLHRIAVPICGNDAAKRLVAGLVDEIGFDGIDIGALPNGRWPEPERPLFARNCTAAELTNSPPLRIMPIGRS
jgi:predicted dinucleotide-binding enzyme